MPHIGREPVTTPAAGGALVSPSIESFGRGERFAVAPKVGTEATVGSTEHG